MVHLTCAQCGKDFEARASRQRYCSRSCAAFSRYGNVDNIPKRIPSTRTRNAKKPKRVPNTRYHNISSPGHPLADRNGLVGSHRAVLFDKVGPGPQECHWCGRDLDWKGEGSRKCISDHLDGNGFNNDPKNLVTSCTRCNIMRGVVGADNFLTHCPDGHERTPENTYFAPCGTHQSCLLCRRNRGQSRSRRAAIERLTERP